MTRDDIKETGDYEMQYTYSSNPTWYKVRIAKDWRNNNALIVLLYEGEYERPVGRLADMHVGISFRPVEKDFIW